MSAYLDNAGLVDDFNGKITRMSNKMILVYETLQANNSIFSHSSQCTPAEVIVLSC